MISGTLTPTPTPTATASVLAPGDYGGSEVYLTPAQYLPLMIAVGLVLVCVAIVAVHSFSGAS